MSIENVRKMLVRQGTPGTYILLGLLIASYVIAWLGSGPALMGLFAYEASSLLTRPWTLFTYPFAYAGNGGALLGMLFFWFWFHWVATSMEVNIGTAKMVGFFFIMTALAAIFLTIGGVLLKMPVGLADLSSAFLPEAALTVAWGTRNAGGIIRLYGIIPLSGKVLAWLTVALLLFAYGPLLGLFAIMHCGLAYLFAANKLPFTYSRPVYKSPVSKSTERRDKAYFEDVAKREKEREERERLRKLFEGSIKDDKES